MQLAADPFPLFLLRGHHFVRELAQVLLHLLRLAEQLHVVLLAFLQRVLRLFLLSDVASHHDRVGHRPVFQIRIVVDVVIAAAERTKLEPALVMHIASGETGVEVPLHDRAKRRAAPELGDTSTDDLFAGQSVREAVGVVDRLVPIAAVH